MLGARNARRAARGEAPLDVDDEIARLTAPTSDPALEAEIRSLVEARNARRVRRGKPPLDVEAEVQRQIRDLIGVGTRPMADPRTFELDELVNRPGTYFNPQTDVVIIVDDTVDVDTEIFNMEDFEGADWVLSATRRRSTRPAATRSSSASRSPSAPRASDLNEDVVEAEPEPEDVVEELE